MASKMIIMYSKSFGGHTILFLKKGSVANDCAQIF